jgi:SAM-dependent methyltransferase
MDKNQYRLKSFVWSSHAVIAQMLSSDSIQSILDVGSNDGFLGQSLDYKPRELCAIDKHNLSLPEAYSFFWQADLDCTDFAFLKGKTFQAIVSADVLEHLKNPNHIISRLKGCLDDTGFFIFSFPNMGFFLVRILSFLGVRPKMERGLYDKTHVHDFDLKVAKLFLNKCGLEILEFRAIPVPMPLFSTLFMERSPLFFVYRVMNLLAQKLPNLFAYQLIFKAKIK